jgi:hypothetical protein
VLRLQMQNRYTLTRPITGVTIGIRKTELNLSSKKVFNLAYVLQKGKIRQRNIEAAVFGKCEVDKTHDICTRCSKGCSRSF